MLAVDKSYTSRGKQRIAEIAKAVQDGYGCQSLRRFEDVVNEFWARKKARGENLTTVKISYRTLGNLLEQKFSDDTLEIIAPFTDYSDDELKRIARGEEVSPAERKASLNTLHGQQDALLLDLIRTASLGSVARSIPLAFERLQGSGMFGAMSEHAGAYTLGEKSVPEIGDNEPWLRRKGGAFPSPIAALISHSIVVGQISIEVFASYADLSVDRVKQMLEQDAEPIWPDEFDALSRAMLLSLPSANEDAYSPTRLREHWRAWISLREKRKNS